MPDHFYPVAFDLPVRPLTGRSDFFVSRENAAAVALIDSFPNGFNGALIFGEKGCGKTHLAHLFVAAVLQKTGQETIILQATEFNTLSSAFFVEKSPYVVLENLGCGVNERELFHLLNDVKSRNGFVLLTAERPPAAWGLTLSDLSTRLKALPCAEILPPGDMLMQAVLIKQFADRQLTVAPEVIAYLLKNMERSFKVTSFVTRRSDEISLAEHRAVTIPLVRRVLSEVNADV